MPCKEEGIQWPDRYYSHYVSLLLKDEGGSIMDNWLFIAILILLPVIWFLLHHSTARKQIYSLHKKKPKFQGVSIQACSAACDNVKSLEGKRFLADEVSILPVIGCTKEKCLCTYMHHRDRRRGIERRLPLSALETVFSEKDQRFRPDRRKQSFA